jgi:uncharacterized membrane protein YeaQ/YmgE (transglycosylase-associated protein family)
MGIIAWIILGLLSGLLARMVMPGKDPAGLAVTILLGIAGALLGGFLANQLGYGGISGFDLRSLAIAFGGAVLILFLFRLLRQRKLLGL